MGQILGPDKISDPVIDSVTQVRLPGQNVITLGGQQFILDNPVMDSTINGIGGLDVGSLGNNETWVLFAVLSGGSLGLVASLLPAPTGFLVFKKVGDFLTNNSAEIAKSRGVVPKFGDVASPVDGLTLIDDGFNSSLVAKNVQKSGSSGGFNTTSTGFVNVTSLSKAITTIGRPVKIGFEPASAPGEFSIEDAVDGKADNFGELRILRNGGEIARARMEIHADPNAANNIILTDMPGCFEFLDEPAAGTYTYSAQARVDSGNVRMRVTNVRMVLTEE